MKNLKKTWRKVQKNRFSKTALLSAAALVVVVAAWAVFSIAPHADTATTASFQAENGTKSGNVSQVSDASAAGGNAVKFNAPSTGGGTCPVSTPNEPGGPDPWGGCWPGAHNTGYPKGLPGDTRTPVTLTNYTGPQEIKTCGAVIENKIIPWLFISAGNGTHSPSTPCITIKNSWVKGTVTSNDISAGPVVISDTEIDSDGDLPYIENAGRYNYFMYRLNSHGGQGVLKCAAYCEAKDNWVHGMRLGGEYHYNAVGGNGMEGGSFLVDHNWLSCGDWESREPGVTSAAGCSAVIGFYGDFAPVRNITINRNFLRSTFDVSAANINFQAGYCINPGYYVGKPNPNPTNMTITDNIFARGKSGKCGVFGPTNSLNKIGQGATNIWSGNRYEDGVTIPRVEE